MEKDGRKTFYADSSTSWRAWLAVHHDQEPGVWLIIYKKNSGRPSVYYPEAVDEALCFGWVDSKPNRRDADSYFQYFSPRNSKSNWSRVNKEKVKRLEAAEKMAPPGLEMVRIARATGTWTALDDVENLIVPEDLAAEFARYDHAQTYWDEFPRSIRRGILEWIFNAKRAPTRAKRIAETARLADQNLRANQFPRQG